MKKVLYAVLIGLLNILLLHATTGLCADQGKTDSSDDIQKMKETIKKQEEMIKQLQAEINKKQDGKEEKASVPAPPRDQQTIAEQALRGSWGCCGTESREIKVTDGTVSIYFKNIYDLIAFFESGAEEHARADHAVFLKATGLERGTIDYYSSQKKLYSISGSRAEAKTTQYY